MKKLALAFLMLTALPAWAVTGTLSADGETEKFSGAYPHIHLDDDFGGGTVQCYFIDDNGAWTILAGTTLTTASDVTVDSARSITVKCALTGSTGPDLKWVIR